MFRFLYVAMAMLLGASFAQAAPPRVVASIKPVHALAAAVMKDIGTPELLLSSAASAHSYSLRPADATMLSRAQVIFWIGPGLETFLEKPLATLAPKAQTVALLSAPRLAVRPMRDLDERKAGVRYLEAKDPHLWLDPDNAINIALRIAEVLAAADPENEQRYVANLQDLANRITKLDEEVRATLAPVRNVPFIVYHDAYQYFQGRYGLTIMGAVTASPELPVGAERLSLLKNAMTNGGVACVFSEPQFEPKLVRTLTEGTSARTGVLDPEGSTLPAGPDAYFGLMRGLAANLVKCLSR